MLKLTAILSALMWFAPLPISALAGSLKIEDLQKQCEKMTVRYGYDDNKKMVQKGESLNGYCVGYLRGSVKALEHQKLVCPKWEKDNIDNHYLLSVVTYYLKRNPSKGADASTVVVKAFKSAFVCKQ